MAQQQPGRPLQDFGWLARCLDWLARPVNRLARSFHRPGGRRVATGLLLLGSGVSIGVIGAVLAQRGQPERLSVGAVTQARVPAAERTLPAGFAPPAAVPVLPPATGIGQPPVEIAVPVVKMRSELVGLRLNRDGALQVPSDYARAGWYSAGSAPGEAGPPALIVGHVDSTRGPAVFYRLRQLRTGDAVLVRRADGVTLRFAVYRIAEYPKSHFPADSVYGATRRAEIRLITCGGEFDRAAGHYLGNVVVYAAATHPARAAAR